MPLVVDVGLLRACDAAEVERLPVAELRIREQAGVLVPDTDKGFKVIPVDARVAVLHGEFEELILRHEWHCACQYASLGIWRLTNHGGEVPVVHHPVVLLLRAPEHQISQARIVVSDALLPQHVVA